MNICRRCQNYYRVTSHHGGYLENISCQGFCILGKLEGDYALFVFTSMSRECPAFVVSDYNDETTQLEDRLKKKLHKYEYNCHDRRTKEYKLFEKMADKDAIKKYTEAKGIGHRFMVLRIDNDIRKAFNKFFIEIHIEDLKILTSRWRLNRYKYFEIIGLISTALHDRIVEVAEAPINKFSGVEAPAGTESELGGYV